MIPLVTGKIIIILKNLVRGHQFGDLLSSMISFQDFQDDDDFPSN
jgi:hypothetical protein